jgi:DNA-directed RNA polymerase specialized sigma subunit
VSVPRDELTVDQWRIVEEALPEAYEIARRLAARCSNHTLGELKALVEDSLRRRVRRFDPTRGAKLIAFARRGVHLDLIRAAAARAEDPLAAGLQAIDRYEDVIEEPDLTARFAESLEEKDTRARAIGDVLMGAAHYAHTAAHVARTPEDELGEREAWDELRNAAGAPAEGGRRLFDLLFEEGMTWDEAAEEVGLGTRQAQRVVEKTFVRLRALLLRRRRSK